MWNKLPLSILGGLSSQSVYLVLSFYLDKIMNKKTSNIIGLLVSSLINFILQNLVFTNTVLFIRKIIIKYIISAFITIYSTQMGVSFIIDNTQYDIYLPAALRKYHTTIIRALVSMVVGVFISYPIRYLWVFI